MTSYSHASDETIRALQNAYWSRHNDAVKRRMAVCKEMADEYIAKVAEDLLNNPVRVVDETGRAQYILWDIVLRREMDAGGGEGSIDIDISGISEYVIRQGSESYPFEDRVNILTGQYILDQSFMEPLYIGKGPSLLQKLADCLPECVDVTLHVREDGMRVLRMTAVE
jgi:hypothetical protein